MRAIISPRGSFIAIARPPSPARLDQPRDQAPGAEIAQRNARELVQAIKPAWPTRYFASVTHPRLRGIAGQLRKLQRRRKSFFHGLLLVARNRFQPGTSA